MIRLDLQTVLLVLVVTATAMVSFAQQGATPESADLAHNLQWKAMEGMPGVSMALISGKLDQEGPFTFRLKLEAGARIPAHTHPVDEYVTVIKGTMLLGYGDKFSEATLRPFKPGGFVAIRANVQHFGQAKGATIIQVHGNGPFGLSVLEKK